MNQKERMLANLPYKAWLDGLEEERLESRKKVYRFNNTPPENEEEQAVLIRLLRRFSSSMAERLTVPPKPCPPEEP